MKKTIALSLLMLLTGINVWAYTEIEGFTGETWYDHRASNFGGGSGSESGMAGDTQQRKPAKGNLMQTGDNVIAIVAVALVAAGVIVAIRRARRRYRA